MWLFYNSLWHIVIIHLLWKSRSTFEYYTDLRRTNRRRQVTFISTPGFHIWLPQLLFPVYTHCPINIKSESNSGYDIPAIDTPSIKSASLLILVSGTFVTQDSRSTESPKVGATLSCELHFPSKYEWICVEKLEKRGRGTVPSLMF